MKQVRKENIHFLYYAIKRVWMAAGGCETEAHYIADAICFAHKQGKLNQGLGVYEAIDIALQLNFADLDGEPTVVSEGPTWATVDGQRTTGYWTLNVMSDIAIEKASEYGIAIVFGANHNDAGSFSRYVYKAYENDMMAFASNNSVKLAAPFGGMTNQLSCSPFDAITPSGEQPPIWASCALAEFYDADVAEAGIYNKPMKGKWLIDPETGELTDDVRPYAQPIEGYGRVWDCTAAGQIETPRTYALNMWNEALTSIINPLGVSVSDMPTIAEVVETGGDGKTTVGGSYFLCINPAVFGDITKVKEKSDRYVSEIRNSKPRPGHTIRVPGEKGYQFIKDDQQTIDVMSNHWQPFFETIAGRYGLSEEILRADFENENS